MDDDPNGTVDVADPLQQAGAFQVRQPQIDDGDAEVSLLDPLQPLPGGAATDHPESLVLHDAREREALGLVVLDDQYAGDAFAL